VIKVLSDKVFSFDQGERDDHGALIRVKTVIGFNDLPEWVGKTDLYKAAVKEGSIKPFESNTVISKDVTDLQKQVQQLQAENEKLKQKPEVKPEPKVEVKPEPKVEVKPTSK